jgi:hypothetical protein
MATTNQQAQAAQAQAQAMAAAAAADSLNIQMLLAASQHISTDADVSGTAGVVGN